MGERDIAQHVSTGKLHQTGREFIYNICSSPLGQQPLQHIQRTAHKNAVFLQALSQPWKYKALYSALPQVVQDAHGKGVVTVKDSKFECGPCSMVFSWVKPLTDHLSSSKHLKKAAGQVPQMVLTPPTAGPSTAQPTFSMFYNVNNTALFELPPAGPPSLIHPVVADVVKDGHVKATGSTDFQCTLCPGTKVITGVEPMRQHLKGKIHKKSLQRGIVKHVSTGELHQTGSEFVCNICSSPLGQQPLQHIRGTTHKNAVFLQTLSRPWKYKALYSALPQVVQDAHGKGVVTVKDSKFKCGPCSMVFSGEKPLTSHISSAKHLTEAAGQGPQMGLTHPTAWPSTAQPTFPTFPNVNNSALFEVTPAGPPSLIHLVVANAVRVGHVKATGSTDFQCTLCPGTKVITGVEPMRQHLEGKIHKKSLQSRIGVTDVPGASNEILSPCSTGRAHTAYKIQSSRPGIVLVFNYVFKGQENVRHGAENDEKNIKEVFERMNYEVHLFTDYTRKNTLQTFSNWTRPERLKNVDSFSVFFLSHGGSTSANEFSTIDKEKISVHEIYSMLTNTKCPNLRDKPKLLFFNFCRGSTEQIHTDEDDSWNPGKTTEAPEDLAIVHASLPFIVAKRNTKTGTLFVKNLCSVLSEHASVMELRMIIYHTSRLMRKENGTTPSFSAIHFKEFFFL